jgi:hypothetical protein
MGKWADSLPDVSGSEGDPSRVALYIAQAIYWDAASSGVPRFAAARAELAAAHLRVWRKALPPQKPHYHGWCKDGLLRDGDALDRGFLLTLALYHLTSALRWGVPEGSAHVPLRDAEKALKIYVKKVRDA